MRSIRTLALLIIALSAFQIHSATITPSDRVQKGVVIRSEPSSSSERLGVLAPDRSAEHVESVSRYYKVKLSGGRFGFVPKSSALIECVFNLPNLQYTY